MNEELAEKLSELTRVKIHLQSETLVWTDGPTVPQMQGLVAENRAWADAGITYRRTSSARAWAARAIAVHGTFTVDVSALRDMDRPDWTNLAPGQRLALDVVQHAVDETPYPNRPDSPGHAAPIQQLLTAAGHHKTRLAEILIARVVDPFLNRASERPRSTLVIYLNSHRRTFYCAQCARTRDSTWFAVVDHDWNRVRCETCA